MTRKTWFWVVFAVSSVVATAFAVRYFDRAFPIVTLELQMDRQSALAAARRLAEERGWGPEEFRQAASFGVDFEVQSFVELEAGGTEAFVRMMEDGVYEAYAWEVRHFQEGVTREVTVRFTPEGRPYGFVETLSEDEPGPEVTAARARAIAETAAGSTWLIDLGRYELVEQAREERPGGRVDHTLVYERPDVHLGGGRIRLRLVVGGDRLTELTHFVDVPEAFQRRYEEMRSANQAISLVGLVGMIAFLLGGVCALALLLDRGWVLWRRATIWGTLVSALMALATLNQWPLYWMGYDTAVSSLNFTLQQIVLVAAQFLGLGLLYVVTFITAESLSRRAFPNHPRLWKVWSAPVAATPAVLGRTVGAYLLIGFFWAYEVGLYFATRETLGWWNPSSSLFRPDALATYFPWLTSIALSLQAGFWEECLFRAIPLASAALLGKRYGKTWAWIAVAMLLQAVVFGAGHASYPAQPAYARLAELILPSLGWGFLYLAFGLLPAIVLHFAIDVSAFAIPLFVSDAPGAWVSQSIVVLLTLTPVWVVLAARWRLGGWRAMPEEGLNHSWSPPEDETPEAAEPERGPAETLGARTLRVVGVLGIAGLAAWGLLTPAESDAPWLRVDRERASAAARDVVEERGVELSTPWRRMARVVVRPGLEHRFVWQEEGESVYRDLLESYLSPPHWEVRFARFEGDVAERAEEYRVFVDPGGDAFRFQHRLPEARPGASLDEAAARAVARSVVEERFAPDPGPVVEISAVPVQRPERRDWTFTFHDRGTPLETGEARIVVEIAGDRVADVLREVHVPEEWARQRRDRQTIQLVVEAASWLLLGLLVIAGMVGAAYGRGRDGFSVRPAALGFGGLLLLHLLGLANGWPQIVAGFSTAQSFEIQLWAILGIGIVLLVLISAAVGVIVGLVYRDVRTQASGRGGASLVTGLALAFAVAGLMAISGSLAPDRLPVWGSYEAAGSAIPLLDEALGPVTTWVQVAAVLLLLCVALDRVTSGWSRRRGLGIALLGLLGIALAGVGSFESLTGWLLSALAIVGVLVPGWLLVVRYDVSSVPLALAGVVALEAFAAGWLRSHPWALPGSALGAVLVLAAAVWWHRGLGWKRRQPG